jgi:hypothetical protein
MTIEKVHQCTKCNETLHYTNPGSWFNARKRREVQGFLHCRSCKNKHASEVNKSNPKITGRPKGSKNREDYVPWNTGLKGQAGRLNRANKENPTKWLDSLASRHGYNTYEEYRESLPEWKAYQIDVWRYTKQQPLEILENYDRRGVNGQEGAYTLDHIISVKKGFMESYPPEEIGHISNLQMLPWMENIQKGWK